MKYKITSVILCMATLLTFMLASCTKKQKQDTNTNENTSASESYWENIGNYSFTAEHFMDIEAPADHETLVSVSYDRQKFLYCVFSNENGEFVIAKYNFKEEKLYKTSNPFSASEVKSACVGSSGLVVLCSDKKAVTFDTSTLEKREEKQLLFDLFAISYNKQSKTYYCLDSFDNIVLLDRDFELVKTMSEIQSSGKARDICVDNNYVYVLSVNESDAGINVYKKDGAYVSSATVSNVKIDAHFVFSIKEEFFLVSRSSNGGAQVYNAVVKKA